MSAEEISSGGQQRRSAKTADRGGQPRRSAAEEVNRRQAEELSRGEGGVGGVRRMRRRWSSEVSSGLRSSNGFTQRG